MFLHIGADTIINQKKIIGIFDIEKTSISKRTREFLAKAQSCGNVVNVTNDIPRSFVVCVDDGKMIVYISQLSSATLLRRAKFGLSAIDVGQ